MAIVNKQTKRKYTKMMRQLVRDYSQDIHQVVLILPDIEVDCPNCMYNRMDKKSANIFNSSFITPITVFVGLPSEKTVSPASFNRGRCPVCFGNGKLTSPITRTIQGHAYWSPNVPTEDGDYSDIPAGRKGENYVMVKTHANNYRLIFKSKAAYIDGVYVELLRPPILRGLAGEESLCIVWFSTVKDKEVNTRY